ncbi:thioredoxin family protein [Acidihalobacter prosperus]|uniref:Thioredoxin-like fold domain-containing protein n=1 Tax=Acidihalobacter prosperus TaxID=160660 RepID=A0A1A6C4W1_9GAMM|nr:thioredoxin family protein [Acidihalobacter prosperus]OBS09589.1 hypothetical protein Thpro_021917 [Acidihalobacter prosperus]
MAGLLLFASVGAHAAGKLPEASDLAAVAAAAGKRPILIEIAQRDCPYCIAVREDFLEPMILSGDYRDRVILLQLHRDSGQRLKGFDGAWVSPEAFAARYNVTVTPTVLLLGPDGRLLTKPLVGLSTPDFYGAFLDEAIDHAAAVLKDAARTPSPQPRAGG